MKAIVVASPRAEHQTSWGGVFADGLRRHGWEVDILNRMKPADLLVLWGVRNSAAIEMQKAQGGEVCILERGYLGDRFKWASVSFGGKLNNRAEFRGVSSDPSRFAANFGHLMQPWRRQTGRRGGPRKPKSWRRGFAQARRKASRAAGATLPLNWRRVRSSLGGNAALSRVRASRVRRPASVP